MSDSDVESDTHSSMGSLSGMSDDEMDAMYRHMLNQLRGVSGADGEPEQGVGQSLSKVLGMAGLAIDAEPEQGVGQSS